MPRTPKNFDSAAPMAGILTWNSSTSTCSTSTAFLRAWREASSNSPADSTASAIRKSYLVLTCCGLERCLKAMARVCVSSATPSSASAPNGTPALLLMIWMMPISSPLPASAIGDTSCCLVR